MAALSRVRYKGYNPRGLASSVLTAIFKGTRCKSRQAILAYRNVPSAFSSNIRDTFYVIDLGYFFRFVRSRTLS
jgi:hypothetical protein